MSVVVMPSFCTILEIVMTPAPFAITMTELRAALAGTGLPVQVYAPERSMRTS